jgi:hypothetical protein
MKERDANIFVLQIMPLFPPPIVFSPLPVDRTPALVKHVPDYDIRWTKPLFRPPSLPTQAQIWSEVPFSARFPAKNYPHK